LLLHTGGGFHGIVLDFSGGIGGGVMNPIRSTRVSRSTKTVRVPVRIKSGSTTTTKSVPVKVNTVTRTTTIRGR